MRFSGSCLTYDFSLPRVRERFTPPVGPADWTAADRQVRETATVVPQSGSSGPESCVHTPGPRR
ncbi:hypothetical protein [Streptomyces lavendulae]|uniref:hypothetical protein n=1 Tax=Streptomyces lavendulae TaxID=1914 RepID=UPI0033E0F6ED